MTGTGRTQRSSLWGFKHLWTSASSSKCKVLIPDTVFFEEAQAVRWCFTSRRGEVVKKKGVSAQAIIDKMTTLSARKHTAFVLRFNDGKPPQEVDRQAVANIVQGREVPVGLGALQMVDGATDLGHYYTQYKLVSASGKAVFRTKHGSKGADGSVHEVECKAAAILRRVKECTQGVIKHVEAVSGVKVSQATLEFSVKDVVVFHFFLKLETVKDMAAAGLALEQGRLDGFGFPKVDSALALGGRK